MSEKKAKEMRKQEINWGKFYIPYEMINNNPCELRVIMGSMAFIAHARMMPDIKMSEYICRSKIFESINPKDDIPEYIIIVDSEGEVRAEKGECAKPKVDTLKEKMNMKIL